MTRTQVRLSICTERGGPRETQIIVACREGEIETADVRALDRAVRDAHVTRGYLVSQRRVPVAAQSESAATNGRVRALTLDAFYRELADFTPYVQFLVKDWEADELAQYYVDLGGKRPHFDADGRELRRDTHKPLDAYLDEWLDARGGNHISILGDYGTGKTTLVRQYAYKLARRYLADPEQARIPILISLRAYAKAMNLRQLITDFLVNEQRDCIRLTGGFAAFEQLNCDGRFALIFDGFDEMARQVTYQTTVDNFNELAKAADGDAKVLLTCRTHYFRETREARRVLAGEEVGEETSLLHPSPLRGGEGSEVKDQPAIDLHQRPNFQIVFLDEFTPDDITTLLQRRFPAKWQEYDTRIRHTCNLADLAKRPVLLNMIVQTLGEWGAEKITNAAQLYRACTEAWMERDIRTGRTFIAQDDKRLFSEELATEVFRTGQLQGIHYSQFPAIVRQHFRLGKGDDIDYFVQDVLTHSFLIRDDNGLYRFAHNSFMEFFVAQKLWRALSAGQADEMPISEEIRAFICGLFEDHLPQFAAPRQISAGMVYVPPGPFVMGGEVYDDEKPTRLAVLPKGCFIDRYPVTHAQYKKFVDAKKHRVPNVDADWAQPYNWDPKTRAFPSGLENHPVVPVSWEDAAAYAQWVGKRLPTEVEWEKAARGIDGRVYPWGDEWDRNKCNSASWWAKRDLVKSEEWNEWWKKEFTPNMSGRQVMTTPIGQFKEGASPYGCFDMVGNVWEWTADWWNDKKERRVVRGGSWDDLRDLVRGAARRYFNPDFRYFPLGFRCAE